MEPAMIDYQTLIGDLVPPPPFLHEDVVLQGMFFEADLQSLTGYVETTIGAIPGVEVEVVSSTLMFATMYASSVRPIDERYENRDGISEVDCGFWLLVRSGRTGGAQALYWTPLCLFVDSVYAVVIGRELYGFPKMLGRIEPSRPSPTSDLSVIVCTDHFVTSAGRSRLARNARLFGVRKVDTSSAATLERVSMKSLNAEVSQNITLANGINAQSFEESSMSPGIPYVHMPMLFLKQFRAIKGTPAADYAAVTTAKMVPTGMPKIERLANIDFELFLEDSDTFYLAGIFGLTTGAPARMPFRVEFSFTAGEGDVIS
jgi:hypothetical protein